MTKGETMAEVQPVKIRARIRAAAFEVLKKHPSGIRWSDMLRAIQAVDSSFNGNTITGSVRNLDALYPDKVYKPSRGLWRLVEFKDQLEAPLPNPPKGTVASQAKIKEEHFYEPFVDWLKNEIEDVTDAIALGGNKFRDKWGTPDVIGKREPARSDIIKGETEIVAAEIKSDTNQRITAFGQACSYKLFSHRAYLVVPCQASDDDISRVDSLCQIFGIGFVTFDAEHPGEPDFKIRVRPARHLPDLFYTNKYAKLIEAELFR